MLRGLLHPQTNKLNDPLHVAPTQRFKSSGNGDDLRRLLLEMAKNAADLAHATRKNGNHKNGTAKPGLRFGRYFTAAGSHAYDLIEWERRTAAIMGEKGQVIFEQKDVEVPRSWSQLAINVVAQKYFRGGQGTPERETSVRQLIDRVVDTLARWGREGNYFAGEEDAENWAEELRYLLVTQHASFNSPVWFNLGVPNRAQQGSVRRGYDSCAGSIKSGGTTRRAAKMVILNADHPDVLDFIRCKADEEKKAWALIEAGYNVGFNVPGGAYDSVQFQNANHSVRAGDDFMRAVADDKQWTTKAVVGGRVVDTYKARDVWKEIAEAAWVCGDPGVQFDTTIQDWNVVPNTGRINATNPCSEFVFLDDTACNLLSLNLMKFQTENGTFDVDRFRRAVDICFTGQEIIVSSASYPTPAIAANSEALRPLGLGYANLGALLMSMGLAYDSDEGRRFAGAITAIMTGRGFAQSARMAQVKGTFSEFAKNREPMLRVMEKHRQAAHQLSTSPESADVVDAARATWDDAVKLGRLHGYRNAQATVLAPTGTIGLMMDCDTTGIEPDLALVKYKKLVGGGLLKIVNGTVPAALRKLGYDSKEVKDIVEYIDENDTIEGAPQLLEEHLKVYDCAFKPVKGMRSIAPMGHVRMMAAVQPFISGSMSKTVNLPTDATVEDIQQTYMESWKLGLKCIAIYRDGCKRSQPLSTSLDKNKKAAGPAEVEYRAMRRKLPDERKAVTHKFDIQGHEGYLTVGMFEDGQPGELFVTMAKEGSTISGLMDAFATQTSYALQFGVPLKFMVDKFSHMRFEPSGFTKNKEIPIAKSIVDYIFRWMASHFMSVEDQDAAGVVRRDAPVPAAASAAAPTVETMPSNELKVIATPANGIQKIAFINTDAPACPDCGAITVRSGSCYKCLNCGATTGCS